MWPPGPKFENPCAKTVHIQGHCARKVKPLKERKTKTGRRPGCKETPESHAEIRLILYPKSQKEIGGSKKVVNNVKKGETLHIQSDK